MNGNKIKAALELMQQVCAANQCDTCPLSYFGGVCVFCKGDVPSEWKIGTLERLYKGVEAT